MKTKELRLTGISQGYNLSSVVRLLCFAKQRMSVLANMKSCHKHLLNVE